MESLIKNLGTHQFTELFIEGLGWDRAEGSIEISIDNRDFHFKVIAQKRGFQVLHCTSNPLSLINRGLLRKVQKQLAKTYHEHIVIYSSNEPLRQVWQWAIRLPDGRRLKHREHPFFSNSPPSEFLDRLNGLYFSIEEEEELTIVDAHERVRETLDRNPDVNLFVRRPKYAEESDKLIRAMQDGSESALHEFILFHRPLARHISNRLVNWFQMEPEEAEQLGILGLIIAAERFEPERGYQFSTYAFYWIRQTCNRYGPEVVSTIRVPDNVFWDCFRIRNKLDYFVLCLGAFHGRQRFLEFLEQEFGSTQPWMMFQQARNIKTLSDRREPEYLQARQLISEDQKTLNDAIQNEQASIVRTAINRLHSRHAKIIRLRYGIDDGYQMTLEEVGRELNVTRERVRQIQKKAEKRLKDELRSMGLGDKVLVNDEDYQEFDEFSFEDEDADVETEKDIFEAAEV